MPRPFLRFPASAVVLTALLSPAAIAQAVEGVDAEAPRSGAVGELAGARLRYGLALRSGAQEDLGPGLLIQSGLQYSDFTLSGWYFGKGHLGAAALVQREAFALVNEQGPVAAGSLVRAQVGPAGRVELGPVRLEALAGYSFSQLAGFGSSVAPSFAPGQRHAVLLASRVLLDLGRVSAEVRGELPVSLAVRDAAGGPGKAQGFSAGAALLFPLGSSGTWVYSGVLDYQYGRDSLEASDGTVTTQSVSRFGASLELKWLDAPPPPPPPRFGGVVLTVVDAETGKPLPEARVVLVSEDAETPLSRGPEGTFAARELSPGTFSARATAAGYLPAEATVTVAAGKELSLELQAKKEPPKVGSLVITITDQTSGAPIGGATVLVRGAEYLSASDGTLTLVDLPPGPVPLKVSARGYRPAQEVASVIARKSSPVQVMLVEEQRKVLATIRGLVRSTRGGRPIAAELEVPQVKIKTRANASGAFTFRVEGGTYSVRISAPGFISQSKTVTVKDGDQAIFNVDLHPK